MEAFGSRCMNFLAVTARGNTRKHMSGRALRGLFAGRDIGFGNNVSHSHRKTRRKFKVNHQWKKLYSETLDQMIGLNVTTHTMRCVDKFGGLDNYLLSLTDPRELGKKGTYARERIAQAMLASQEAANQIASASESADASSSSSSSSTPSA